MPRHTHPAPVRKHSRAHTRRQRRRWIAKRLTAAAVTDADLTLRWWRDGRRAGTLANAAPWFLHRACRCAACFAPLDTRAQAARRRALDRDLEQGLADWQERG